MISFHGRIVDARMMGVLNPNCDVLFSGFIGIEL
jgi:hypothetical protein